MKLKRALLVLLLGFCTIGSYSQNDSCTLNISLLTCSPGGDLYSIFGHSALRVRDSRSGTDIVYNYGTFNFDDPDFYLKFVKGKLLYYVSVERFSDFIYSYQMENRSITEQLLNISCTEKQQLYNALQVNAKEQNKYYHYEFLFDNCSTRLRDIVVRNTNDNIHFRNIIARPTPSFRNMLHDYLNKGRQYWSKAGIDLLLGSRIDRKVKNEEAMFLPDYLLKGFDSADLHHSSLVKSKKAILGVINIDLPVSKDLSAGWIQNLTDITPLNISVLILLLVTGLTFIKAAWSQKFLNLFDTTFFFVVGSLGWLILFMWFSTEHELCDNNYNILWALPVHLPMAFFILKKKPWIKKYLKIIAVFYLLLLTAWSFLPQGMNPAFLPVALLAGIRSFDRFRNQ